MLSTETTYKYITDVVERAEPKSVFNLHKSAAQLVGKPTFISTTDEHPDVLLAIKESEAFAQEYCYQQWLKELNYQWSGIDTHPSESSQAGAVEDNVVYDADITDFDFVNYLKLKFDNVVLSPAEVDQLVKGIVELIGSEGSTVHNTWQGHYKKFELKDDSSSNLASRLLWSDQVTSYCDFYFTDATVPDKNGTPVLLMYWCACYYKAK